MPRSFEKFLRRVMNQSNCVSLFVQRHQTGTYREHIFDIGYIVLVKLAFSYLNRKGMLQLYGSQWSLGTRNPCKHLHCQLPLVWHQPLDPLHGFSVRSLDCF
jgi:hypothetical protein